MDKMMVIATTMILGTTSAKSIGPPLKGPPVLPPFPVPKESSRQMKSQQEEPTLKLLQS